MSAEKYSLLATQLAHLLGPSYAFRVGETIVVQPASAKEMADVLKLARREKVPVEHRITGPAVSSIPGAKVVISQERMNTIRHVDREGSYLVVDPAVPCETIVATARTSGFIFPGEKCPHLQVTIGERVAACFKEGAPAFHCHTACLCGLEVVLEDGEIVTAGGGFIRDLSNYGLAYLLSGYGGGSAILTGIFLKMITATTSQCCLVVSFKNMEGFLGVFPTLLAEKKNQIQQLVAMETSLMNQKEGLLKNVFGGPHHPGVLVMISLQDALPGWEQTAREMGAWCLEKGAEEVLLSCTPNQADRINSLFYTYLDAQRKTYDLQEIKIVYSQDVDSGLHRRAQIKALIWDSSGGRERVFYTD